MTPTSWTYHLLCFAALSALLLPLGPTDALAGSIRFDGGGTVLEGDSGTTAVTFRAYAAGLLQDPIRFSYSTEGISATEGLDFESVSGYGVLAPGIPVATQMWATTGECGEPTRALDIAIDGNLWVATSRTVNEYSPNGALFRTFGGLACVGSALSPRRLTFGGNYVHVLSNIGYPERVEVWRTTGTYFTTYEVWAGQAVSDGWTVNDMASGSGSEVWFCGHDEVWNSGFIFLQTEDFWWITENPLHSIVVPGNGFIYIVELLSEDELGNMETRIVRGKVYGYSFYPDDSFTPLIFQNDVKLAAAGQSLYVMHRRRPTSANFRPAVSRYTLDGIHTGDFGTIWPQDDSIPGLIVNPTGIAATTNGQVFITEATGQDSGNIHKFEPTAPTDVVISVDVYGDGYPETNESFRMTMQEVGSTGYTTLLSTINDDDPGVFVAGATRAEGDSGTSLIRFQVGVTTPISSPVNVAYATRNGSATVADGDYLPESGSLVFLPSGSVAPEPQLVSVTTLGDRRDEGDETLFLDLTSVSGAVTVGGSGTGVLLNDEVSLSVEAVTIAEGDADSVVVGVQTSARLPFYTSLQVHHATADQSAFAGADYVARVDSLVIPPIAPMFDTQFNLYNGSTTRNPNCITIDHNGNILIADKNTAVYRFSPDGQELLRFGATGDLVTVQQGQAIAVDSQGHIYVADRGEGVKVFNGDGGYVTGWGGNVHPIESNNARSVAVGPSDIVYVVDTAHEIEKYTVSGTLLGKWGSAGSGPGQFGFPVGIAIDANHAVYVSDNELHRIQKFSATGEYLGMWGSFGTGPGQFNTPYGIRIDAKGRVHVVDEGNRRVQVFTPDGAYVTEYSPIDLGGSLDDPWDLAFDPAGRAWIVDQAANNVGAYVIESFTMDTPMPSIPITVLGDVCPELVESLVLTVVGTVGGSPVDTTQATVTIVDDDITGPPIHVDASAAPGGDGTSWGSAIDDLALALAQAAQSSGDSELWVAAGTYYPTAGGDRTATFLLSDCVQVYGGFSGTESSRDERDPGAQLTILSGDIGIPGDPADNSHHVVSCVAAADTVPLRATLDGFTITGANSAGLPEATKGGGIRVKYGTLFGSNLRIIDNLARYGGGIANEYGVAVLENVEIAANVAVRGGGVFGRFSTTTLINAVVRGNTADFYGGIGLIAADLTLAQATIAGNHANTVIGGLSMEIGSTIRTRNSILWGNTAPSLPHVYLSGSVHDVSHSLLQGSGGSGGGWDFSYGADGGSNLDTDPMFVTGSSDVRLQIGSPAIDAGDTGLLVLPPVDLDDNPRVAGGVVDMGAYEYGSSPVAVDEDPTGATRPDRLAGFLTPNPASTGVTMSLSFSMPDPGDVDIAIYDVRGRRVSVVDRSPRDAGQHRIQWKLEGSGSGDLGAGVYFVRVATPTQAWSTKFVLVR